ncbi:MAG: tRNA lysidine(34) synthetase TilS [Thermoleophilia bacterium]
MVSGGQDSVALLHLLAGGLPGIRHRLLQVLHVNHHLRGPVSDADEALVRRHSEDLGVPLVVEHRPLDSGANLQARAREERRAAALALAAQVEEKTGRDVRIATGHTQDDQVETLLYRLGRYGGLAALDGLRPLRPPWVRPLLGVRRSETEEFCRAEGLNYARDRGNESSAYARTGLRRAVLPAWERELPGAVGAAARAAEVAGEVRDALDGLLVSVEQQAAAGPKTGRVWSVWALRAFPPPLRRLFLYHILGQAGPRDELGGVTRAQVQELEHLLWTEGTAELSLGTGLVARKEYGGLQLVFPGAQEEAVASGSEPVWLPMPGAAYWGGLRVEAAFEERFWAAAPARTAFLDASVLGVRPGQEPEPILVRGVRPGDRMRPLGAPGTRKVQDILVDSKVPRAARARIPVFEYAGRVLWLGGYQVLQEGRITRQTERILRLGLGEGRAD